MSRKDFIVLGLALLFIFFLWKGLPAITPDLVRSVNDFNFFDWIGGLWPKDSYHRFIALMVIVFSVAIFYAIVFAFIILFRVLSLVILTLFILFEPWLYPFAKKLFPRIYIHPPLDENGKPKDDIFLLKILRG